MIFGSGSTRVLSQRLVPERAGEAGFSGGRGVFDVEAVERGDLEESGGLKAAPPKKSERGWDWQAEACLTKGRDQPPMNADEWGYVEALCRRLSAFRRVG